MEAHILLVEDDGELRSMTAEYLSASGFRVTALPDGRTFDAALATGRPDVVVLDLMLPGTDGLALCRRVRERAQTPVIMVTGVGTDVDRILGLEIGADDYLMKPVIPRELVARVRAVLRRTMGPADRTAGTEAFGFRGWRLDVSRRQLVDPSGVRVALTTAEFDLLATFCRNPGRVLSRDQLIDHVHGRTAGPLDRSIDILVSRLRAKLEDDPKLPTLITTVRLAGYVFSADVVAA